MGESDASGDMRPIRLLKGLASHRSWAMEKVKESISSDAVEAVLIAESCTVCNPAEVPRFSPFP